MAEGRLRTLGCVVVLLLGVVTVRAQPAATSEKSDAFAEAARKGDAVAVKKLLDDGVDVNTKFRYEVTALSYACDRGHLDVVKLLLERGAEVNVEDTFYHATPLTWAVSPAMGRKPQHAEIVGLLLKRGAKGKDGALMGAVAAKDLEMTKTILATGGLSASALSDALESAARGGSKDVAALLEQAGAKPFVEFKIDETDLTKYAGTYRNMSGVEVVLAVVDGHLTGGPNGQRASLVARDRTTFKLAEVPGITVTFRLDGGSVVEMTFNQGGGTQVFSRVQGK